MRRQLTHLHLWAIALPRHRLLGRRPAAGIPIDLDRLQAFLDRRAPGSSDTSTTRREADAVEFIAGITEGHTNGAPIAAIIRNRDMRKL